jgi:radical SAM superfamily enzyme
MLGLHDPLSPNRAGAVAIVGGISCRSAAARAAARASVINYQIRDQISLWREKKLHVQR